MKKFILFSPDNTNAAGGGIKNSIDPRIKPLEHAEVRKLSNAYQKLVTKDPSQALLMINMSDSAMQLLGNLGDDISFISGADESGIQTMVVAIYNKVNQKTNYYLYNDFFLFSQNGMSNRRALCPPPTVSIFYKSDLFTGK